MRYKTLPDDFVVEEQIRLPLSGQGDYAIYRVQKRGVTTLAVQAEVARQFGLPLSAVVFPALKDRDAVATQYASVHGTGPAYLTGPGFRADFVGRARRPLAPGDLQGNRFTVVLRDLSTAELARAGERLPELAADGLPNYFDEQRFGSQGQDGSFIGRLILQRDAAGVLHAYLSQSMAGDPPEVRRFKRLAAERWDAEAPEPEGGWGPLFEAAPKPSNWRSVLTYLRDHPGGDPQERAAVQRKAVNLITRRLLALYLAAYQSHLWNRIVSRVLCERLPGGPERPELNVAGVTLSLYRRLPVGFDRNTAIALPGHRAEYPDPGVARIVTGVLAEEGLTLADMKARILKDAYLPRGVRRLILQPQDMVPTEPAADERFPGQHTMGLAFTLPPGSYATLVLKAAQAG